MTLPPLIFEPGQRVSHEVKCFSVGHLFISVPHSDISRNAKKGPTPCICVISVPIKR